MANKYLDYISCYYGSRRAERSKVLYINHITEGLKIAKDLYYCQAVRDAFCIHPMFQSDECLAEISTTSIPYVIDPYVMMLVMEYRRTANDYLSVHSKTIDEICLSPIKEVNQMLVMDKVQNKKDFELYHKDTHARSAELSVYFDNWLAKLGVTEEEYQRLKGVICPEGS
jgi:hypothetical protein